MFYQKKIIETLLSSGAINLTRMNASIAPDNAPPIAALV